LSCEKLSLVFEYKQTVNLLQVACFIFRLSLPSFLFLFAFLYKLYYILVFYSVSVHDVKCFVI